MGEVGLAGRDDEGGELAAHDLAGDPLQLREGRAQAVQQDRRAVRAGDGGRLMRVGGRGGQQGRPNWQLERVAVPLQHGNVSGRAPKTGSFAAACVQATSAMPTSGTSPVKTFAPSAAARSCAPRQTPQYGTPAATARAM